MTDQKAQFYKMPEDLGQTRYRIMKERKRKRLIDANALKKELWGLKYTEEEPSIILSPAGQEIFNSGIESAIAKVLSAPTIDAATVIHFENINTSLVSVKNVDEWKDRIVLDEGKENRVCAVYYRDTDDAVPVVHARWEYHWFDSLCSACGYRNKPDGVTRIRHDTKFCPNCGARMDGEAE